MIAISLKTSIPELDKPGPKRFFDDFSKKARKSEIRN